MQIIQTIDQTQVIYIYIMFNHYNINDVDDFNKNINTKYSKLITNKMCKNKFAIDKF